MQRYSMMVSRCLTFGPPRCVGLGITKCLVCGAFRSIGVDTESAEVSQELVTDELFSIESSAQVELQRPSLHPSVMR